MTKVVCADCGREAEFPEEVWTKAALKCRVCGKWICQECAVRGDICRADSEANP